MSVSPPPPAAARSGQHRNRTTWRPVLRAVLGDAVPPLAVFFALTALGVSDVIAYTAGGVVPVTRLIVDRILRRPFNAVSGMIAALLLVSVVLAIVTHDARAVIARGGVTYLVLAVVGIASLATRKPAVLLLSRHIATRAGADATARFDETFAGPQAVRAMRIVTATWAAGLTVSAILCVAAAYSLPIAAAAVTSSLIEPAAALVLAAGTMPLLRHTMTPRAAVTVEPAPPLD